MHDFMFRFMAVLMCIPTRARALSIVCAALALAACGDTPTDLPPVVRNEPARVWKFFRFPADQTDRRAVEQFHAQSGGTVQDDFDYGPLSLIFGGATRALGEVFSSPTGETYWVSARGPNGSIPGGDDAIGNAVELEQTQSFIKIDSNATLDFVITGVTLEAVDEVTNPTAVVPLGCVRVANNNDAECIVGIFASVGLDIDWFTDSAYVGVASANLDLAGQRGDGGRLWSVIASVGPEGEAIWKDSSFDVSVDGGSGSGRHVVAKARAPITYRIDLDGFDVGDEFTLRVTANATTFNTKLGGDKFSYVAAFLRDPVSAGGTEMRTTGLRATNNPRPPPPRGNFSTAPACVPGGAAGGTLQFKAATFRTQELPVGGQKIVVTRSGGSSGAASATVTTRGGSAISGIDYTPVTTIVAFADGDTVARTVRIPILTDTLPEPDKSVNVTLSDPHGCATLGASSAVLMIIDNDRPPVATPTFAVGGTVSGLAGRGLVLRNGPTGENLTPANGAFAFTQRSLPGLTYAVTVLTQPNGPSQLCAITGGSGTVGSADVTNVVVTCVTPASGVLDPGFSGDGIAQKALAGARGGAVALQPDGKIVVAGYATVGASTDFALTRFNLDGTPDNTFGTGGTVTTGFAPNSRDEGFDVAVQPDGKIVVAGRSAASAVAFDFALVRYKVDGTLDPTFSGDGLVTTDFGAGIATARALVIQLDGKILVVGDAEVGIATDFALARYNADGGLDTTFGSGGKSTADFTAGDIGNAIALLPDGRFIVAGQGAIGIEKDFALARFARNGAVDRSFGTNGHVATNVGGVDEAFGVVVAPDGKIVAAGAIDALPAAVGVDFALVGYNADGSLDASFGTGGKVTTNFTAGRDRGAALVRQTDGKLVVGGLTTASSLAFNNFALARYRTDGSLDTGFGLGGKLTVDVGGGHSSIDGLVIQADGRIVAAGIATSGSSPGFAVVRVLP